MTTKPFEPYIYTPQVIVGGQPSGMTASQPAEAASGGTSGGLVTWSGDVGFSTSVDIKTINSTFILDCFVRPDGTAVNAYKADYQAQFRHFLGFPGDGTPGPLLLYLTSRLTKPPLGSGPNQTDRLTGANPYLFGLSVEQRDVATGVATVVYPDTPFGEYSRRVEMLRPVGPMVAMNPMFLILRTHNFLYNGLNEINGFYALATAFRALRVLYTIQLQMRQVSL